MTPQKREGIQKFYYSLNAGVEGGGHQEIDEQQDMDRIIDLLAQTRRAALLEACVAVSQFSSDGRPIDAQELRIALVQLLGEMAK